MEEIFDLLYKLMQSSNENNYSCLNIRIVKDDKGDITITYRNPCNTEEYIEIKKYLDGLDDDIISAAGDLMKVEERDSYNVIAKNIESPEDIDALVKAIEVFKRYVNRVVNDKIEKLNEEIEELYKKYLKD